MTTFDENGSITRVCAECFRGFEITASEAAWIQRQAEAGTDSRNWQLPKRCPACRASRRDAAAQN